MFCCTTSCEKSVCPGDELQPKQPVYPSNWSEEAAFPYTDDDDATAFKLTPDTAPEPADLFSPKKSRPAATVVGEETFKFLMTRAKKTTSWGVDFAADSGMSLTVSSLKPGGAIAECNAAARSYAAKPLAPGDVIVAIDGATTQAEMVAKLTQETSLTADVVRTSAFDAVIVRNSTRDGSSTPESLGMKVIRSNGKLLIEKIELTPSPIKRYNAQNHVKPLVVGDTIVSVDSTENWDEMIYIINTSAKFTLSIERRKQPDKKRSNARAAVDERHRDSVRDVARAA